MRSQSHRTFVLTRRRDQRSFSLLCEDSREQVAARKKALIINVLCWQADLGFLASRTVRRYIAVVEATRSVNLVTAARADWYKQG